MSEPDPDMQSPATRKAVEKWLMEHPDAVDYPDEFEVLNLRVWAEAFLRGTEGKPKAIREELQRQGERHFAERVVRSAVAVFDMVPDAATYDTVGRAFTLEAMCIDAAIIPWKLPGSDEGC